MKETQSYTIEINTLKDRIRELEQKSELQKEAIELILAKLIELGRLYNSL
jgi:uncharacterized coiled-coil protein SlyX